jgi:hypothetical protein
MDNNENLRSEDAEWTVYVSINPLCQDAFIWQKGDKFAAGICRPQHAQFFFDALNAQSEAASDKRAELMRSRGKN